MSNDLGDIDNLNLKPTSDDVARRTQGRSGRSGRSDAPRQSSFNGTLVFVIMLMAIVMGIGGYTIYEVQKKLDAASGLLAKGEANIDELEKRLNAAGSDVSKTLVEINDRMDTSEHEIRKLWDVGNKRNRKWIEDNQGRTKNNASQLVSINKKLSTVDQQIKSMSATLLQASTEREEFQLELAGDVEGLLAQMKLLRKQLQNQTDNASKVTRQLANIGSRQKNADEAIGAIDEHRRILNQQLAELQNQVKMLQSRSTSSGF